MTMTDPVADMLTRIRNANTAFKDEVEVPRSRVKEEIARLLAREGYVQSFRIEGDSRLGAPVLGTLAVMA